MTSNKYTCCVPAVWNLGTLGTYLQFFSLHTYSFSGLGSWKWWLSFFFSERCSKPQPGLFLASGFNLFAWCQDESNIAAMAVMFSKCPGMHKLPFGGHWEQREHSATTLLLYIYRAHFIQKDNKGILQVLDIHHHWNVASLALEGGVQILHGSQQTHRGRQCFGYNSSINYLLV